MVDTLALGASGSNPMEVQVLSSAPKSNFFGIGRPRGRLFLWSRAAQTRCFQGGEKNFGQPLAAPFWFLPPLAVFDIIQMHTNQTDRSFFLALIAVLYKLDLSDLCATGRLFKL